jgi:hypothetical protein
MMYGIFKAFTDSSMPLAQLSRGCVMEINWPFKETRNTAIFTTRDVVEAGKPILVVTHDQDDGAWQFHTKKSIPDSDATIAALDEIVYDDPSVVELADLPLGWSAIRDSITTPWKRQPISSPA